ncbi:MAG: helix-turn-helix transcriptional regulator [Nitrospinae bacterium]|nr:helix-turn-helix transcriptional regulator [Nitrospinota bacterium]
MKICKEGTYPDKIIHKAMVEGIQSQMDDLEAEIRDYERLKGQKTPRLKISSLKELPDILVRSRIAHGYNQKQFAKMLDMPEQQIQRYEAENYRRVSFETLMRICQKLRVDIAEGSKVTIEY